MDANLVLNHLQKVNWLTTTYYYIINWRVRRQVNLQKWIKNNLTLPKDLIDKFPNHWSTLKPHDLIKAITKFVKDNIKYVSDMTQWGVEEMWSTPIDTWTTKEGDCEDGALLIYAIAKYYNISDYQMYVTAGYVRGGGHCYLIFVSEKDALEYPMDWCYWPSTSLKMETPYWLIKNYLYGEKEWLRFNATGSYKLHMK